MATLVTGGTGFVGAYVVRALLRAGHEVVTLDSVPSNVIEGVLTTEERARARLIQGDVASMRSLARAIRDHRVDRIVHLASMLHPAADENPALAVDVNIGGHATILEAARIFGLAKVVWASSVVVFGGRESHDQGPLPNDASHHPRNVYGATKSFDEFLSAHYVNQWEIDALGLRFTVIYGPGRVRGASSFIDELAKPALGRPADVPFGDDVLDWQYVDDVAALIAKCVQLPRTKTLVFNTQFDRRSVRAAGAYVGELIPDARITYQPGEFGIAWELDDSVLQEEIGFEASFTMERGLHALLSHTRQQAGLPQL